jgi:hypothetical protein
MNIIAALAKIILLSKDQLVLKIQDTSVRLAAQI